MDSIVAYRNLMTDLMLDIYNQLPQNDPSAPAALRGSNLAALKSVPRSERRQIFIQKIGLHYWPDLTSVVNNPGTLGNYADDSVTVQVDTSNVQMGGMPGAMGGPDQGGGIGQPGAIPGAGNPAGGMRGFLVTIKCTTPNGSGMALIDQ